MKIHVLGAAAGGGFPQWNCNCRNCDGVRKGTVRATPRTQSSIAVSSNGIDWLLFNTSPDLLQQIKAFPAIGDHVMIGPAVQLYTASHHLQAESRIQGWEVAKRIVIADNVWIGGGAILLPGVSIGRNAVVGAGAVVTRGAPAIAVVAGNPARVIRVIENENQADA